MSILIEQKLNLFKLQKILWMVTRPTNKSVYDFPFKQFFECQSSWQLPPSITAVARIGAIDDYENFYQELSKDGIQLIHTPDEHLKSSELPYWYPILSDLTPRSIWFSERPNIKQITEAFEFPLFLKGSRQTSRHQRSLSIIENADALEDALKQYALDPILHWQQIVCREYVELRPIGEAHHEQIPASFEFRTFWWRGELVGAGRYWIDKHYQWTAQEQEDALDVARTTVQRLNVPFLVVDVAQGVDGRWILIECNDAQESGYADISPFNLWKNILAIEHKRADSTSEEE